MCSGAVMTTHLVSQSKSTSFGSLIVSYHFYHRGFHIVQSWEWWDKAEVVSLWHSFVKWELYKTGICWSTPTSWFGS